LKQVGVTQMPNSPIRIQFGVRGWAAIGMAAAMLALLVFLALGFLILLLPIALIGSALYWLLPRPRIYRFGNPGEESPAEDVGVIEGTFRAGKSDTDAHLMLPGKRDP
jgi:hypothetical protein